MCIEISIHSSKTLKVKLLFCQYYFVFPNTYNPLAAN